MNVARVVVVYGQGFAREAGVDVELVESVESVMYEGYWRAVEQLARALDSEVVKALAKSAEQGLVDCIVSTWVDGLAHEALGGSSVIELYGSVLRLKCRSCGYRVSALKTRVPRCSKCGQALEADVVPKGSPPPQHLLREALYELSTADLVVVLGLERCDALTYTMLALARKYGALILCGGKYSRELEAVCHYCVEASCLELLTQLRKWAAKNPVSRRVG